MKKPLLLLTISLLAITAIGCENAAKTSENAPKNADQSTTAPNTKTEEQTQKDAVSDTRKDQIQSDIRAREQRNNATGGDANRDDTDLASEVRGKLEVNIPKGQLTVDSKQGEVTVSGTVPTQGEVQKINKLAMEIKGVKKVTNKVTVAPATSAK